MEGILVLVEIWHKEEEFGVQNDQRQLVYGPFNGGGIILYGKAKSPADLWRNGTTPRQLAITVPKQLGR